MDICHRLKAARLATGKTQEQVASDARMNVTQYNGYERGRSRPAPDTLKRLAEALQTTPEDLLVDYRSAPPSPAGFDTAAAIARARSQLRDQVAAELGIVPEGISIRIELV
jgi:transcriptional regulator with XRE-family HTH domain